MMYFIPWCVFLVVVIFAVPVASVMDGRKRGSSDETGVPAEEEYAEGEAEEFAAEDGFGGDDGFGDAPAADEAVVEFEEFQ